MTFPIKPTLVSPLTTMRVKHTRIKQMMTDISTSLDPNGPILAVIGPTGVGKSVLGHFLVDETVRAYAQEMAANPGFLPAIWVEAPNSGEGEFSWRLFYMRILAALGENMDMPRQAYGVDPVTGRLIRPARNGGNALAGLRLAVEQALVARGVGYMVIDEAAQITRHTKGERLIAQVDTLKSLSNSCGVQLVLLGSFDLYDLVSLSAQIARRIQVMHFPRYLREVAADELAFRKCVSMFQKERADLWGETLMAEADALMENTVGCVGTLRDVLVRAEKISKARGGWSKDVLIEALLTEAQREKILEETLDGEIRIVPGVTRALHHENEGAMAKEAR